MKNKCRGSPLTVILKTTKIKLVTSTTCEYILNNIK